MKFKSLSVTVKRIPYTIAQCGRILLASSVFLGIGAILMLLSLQGCSKVAASENYAEIVDPMIGTDFTGNTYPGAQAPFGMVQLSPDNGLPGWDRIAGYFYPDSTIAGFSHTHLSGTGAGDLYDISFMPVTMPMKEAQAPLGIHSKFTHDKETARAGYYKVHLDDYNIDVELTATPRAGIQRYTFPEGDAGILLNLDKATNWDRTLDSRVEVIDSVTIAGYRFSDGWARNQKVYFATRFSRPINAMTFDRRKIEAENGDSIGEGVVASLYFPTKKGDQVTVSTALSPTSAEEAIANLKAEVPTDDFDHYLAQTTQAWNDRLGRVRVTTNNADRKKVFYTALYHAMLAPTIYNNVDGSYLGPDGKIHQADGWTNYSTFSLWDTYRASHPLFTLLDPTVAGDMARSLVEFADQNGRLPVWNMWASETDMMIGYHSAPVIVDAIFKNLGEIDSRKALDLMVQTARMRDYRQLGDYIDKGYVPVKEGDNWSMSKTMEYAFDDWCIALLAEKLGDEPLRKEFADRAGYYANTFNPATGFFQPRKADGTFVTPFVPEEYTEDICESNAWQYLFAVQHDLDGLTELLGGRQGLENKLDSMFTYVNPDIELPIFSTGMIGQYAHGNEPGQHVAYLYNLTDNPWKGTDYLRQIMETLYTSDPAGICGNDDTGQMSAWYVFSALGFYPVNPVDGRYAIGAPMFERAELDLPNGKTLTITAEGLSDENRYIESVSLNGKQLTAPWLTHGELLEGGTLEFRMTSEKVNPWKK